MKQRWTVVGIVLAAWVAVAAAWAASAGPPPGGTAADPAWAGAASAGDSEWRPAQAGPAWGPRHRPGMGRGRGFGMGPGHLGMGERALARLDLNQEQRARIAELHEGTHRKAIRTRADLETARLDLHQLMRADKPDRRAIEAQIDRISALRAGLEKSRVATLLDVRAVLTPEQLDRLEQLRGGTWGEGRGRGLGRGPGFRGGPPDEEDEDEEGSL